MKKILILLFMAGAICPALSQKQFIPSQEYLRLTGRAVSLYGEKNYQGSGLCFDSAFMLAKGNGLLADKYNAACSWALAGNADKAFYYLKKATDEDAFSGIKNLDEDTDLSSLKKDARWQPLVEQVMKNKMQADAKLNKPLAAMLDSIYDSDQGKRLLLDSFNKKYGMD
jgi:hypothetical protein